MSKKKHRAQVTSNPGEYQQGYIDGLQAAFDESELDAFYTGVGFGKSQNGDKHIGFNSPSERASFERGMRDSKKHFNAERIKKETSFERWLRSIKAKLKYKTKLKSADKNRRRRDSFQKRKNNGKLRFNGLAKRNEKRGKRYGKN